MIVCVTDTVLSRDSITGMACVWAMWLCVRPGLWVVAIVGLGGAGRPGTVSAARGRPCVWTCSRRECVSLRVSLRWCAEGRARPRVPGTASVCAPLRLCVRALRRASGEGARAAPGLLPENSGAAS